MKFLHLTTVPLLTFLLAAGQAQNNNQGNQGGGQTYGNTGSYNELGSKGSRAMQNALGSLTGVQGAPQFLAKDASMFINAAVEFANGMKDETNMTGLSPQVIANQSRSLSMMIDRAHGDLQSLQSSASQSGSNVSQSDISKAMSDINTARQQFDQIASSAGQGTTGNNLANSIDAAISKLNSAKGSLGNIVDAYNSSSNQGSGAAGGRNNSQKKRTGSKDTGGGW
jgi:hypothetical protein